MAACACACLLLYCIGLAFDEDKIAAWTYLMLLTIQVAVMWLGSPDSLLRVSLVQAKQPCTGAKGSMKLR